MSHENWLTPHEIWLIPHKSGLLSHGKKTPINEGDVTRKLISTTFRIKIVVRAWENENKLKFFKKSFPSGSRVPQSQKSFLELFFDRRYLAKKFFLH